MLAPDPCISTRLYEALALLDAVRAGRARERNLAQQKLEELLADGG
jgi:hypothetical protein